MDDYQGGYGLKLLNIDMKAIYSKMIFMHTNWPSIKVFDEMDEDVPIIRCVMPNGNSIYYLRNNPGMLMTLMDELENPKAPVRKAMDFENHRLENEELMEWVYVVLKISEMLNVNCPQVAFLQGEDAFNFAGEGLLVLPDKKPEGLLNIIEQFICIAHELRHEWQHKNHPEWNEGYIQPETEEEMLAYFKHPAEVDAEAFARKLANEVFDLNLHGRDLFNTPDYPAIDLLINRANEIDLGEFDKDIFSMFIEKVDADFM